MALSIALLACLASLVAGGAEEATGASMGGHCQNQPWDTDFSQRMYECGLQSGGQVAKAGDCLESRQGLSACGYSYVECRSPFPHPVDGKL